MVISVVISVVIRNHKKLKRFDNNLQIIIYYQMLEIIFNNTLLAMFVYLGYKLYDKYKVELINIRIQINRIENKHDTIIHNNKYKYKELNKQHRILIKELQIMNEKYGIMKGYINDIYDKVTDLQENTCESDGNKKEQHFDNEINDQIQRHVEFSDKTYIYESDKPVRLSKQLSKFLKFKDGICVSKLTALKEFFEYVRINNLQDKENKQIIQFDDNIKELFNININNQYENILTYFNLPKFLEPHFKEL